MLTKKQKELFDYLKDYISNNQISPSFEEMKDAVNLKSKSGIHRLITSLEQRGFIKRLKHRARAMEIIEKVSNNENTQMESVNIPLIGAIAAGEAIEAIEQSNDFISIPSSMTSPNAKYFGLKVKGLSMIDEGIFDGDIVVIKKDSQALTGDIIVALIDNNEVTLKKFRSFKNSIALEPANKNYKTRIFGEGRVKIQGILVGLIRKFK